MGIPRCLSIFENVDGKQIDNHVTPLSTFVNAKAPLYVGDAVAAIIVVEDGRYLLQLRDDLETIWYPGHWGCFGGAVDPGEKASDSLYRELWEELGLKIKKASFFIDLEFNLVGLGLGKYYRKYFELRIEPSEIENLNLQEGEAVEALKSETILGSLKVTPYDAFALFLHARSNRIG